MIPEQEHPALRYEARVAELERRAKLAAAALAVTIAVRVADAGARLWSIVQIHSFDAGDGVDLEGLEHADAIVNATFLAHVIVLVATAVLFLRWLHLAVELTRRIGHGYLAWKPSTAVWSFFVPVLSFFRPYLVLRDVQRNLTLEDIAQPGPRVDREASHGYREAVFVEAPAAKALSSAFVGGWWATYMTGHLVSSFAGSSADKAQSAESVVLAYQAAIVGDALEIVAALLAVRVAMATTGRVVERFRRIRYTSPESLAAQGVSVR